MNKIINLFLFSNILVSAFTPSKIAHAARFTITNRVSADAAITDPLADALEAQINDSLFPAGAEDPLLKAVGNANASSTRGLGTDAVSNWNVVSVSAAVAGAVQNPNGGNGNAGAKTNSFPSVGVGAQAGLSVGLPAKTFGLGGSFLGLDPSKLNFYANFMTLSLSNIAPGTSVSFSTFGLMGQYILLRPVGSSFLFSWNGLSVSSGLQYASSSGTFTTPISTASSGGGATMSYNATVDLKAESSVFTLPIEATTGITLARFLTLYTGLGVDLNMGSTKITGGSTGPVTAKDGSGSTIFTGTGVFDATSPSGKSPVIVDMRSFFGTQFNIFAFKIFAQATVSTPDIIGVAGGLRVAF